MSNRLRRALVGRSCGSVDSGTDLQVDQDQLVGIQYGVPWTACVTVYAACCESRSAEPYAAPHATVRNEKDAREWDQNDYDRRWTGFRRRRGEALVAHTHSARQIEYRHVVASVEEEERSGGAIAQPRA